MCDHQNQLRSNDIALLVVDVLANDEGASTIALLSQNGFSANTVVCRTKVSASIHD